MEPQETRCPSDIFDGITPTLDWDNPVPEGKFEPHKWVLFFVPQNYVLQQEVQATEGADTDALTKRHLAQAASILDMRPQPENAAEANLRLRQYTEATRKSLAAHKKRMGERASR